MTNSIVEQFDYLVSRKLVTKRMAPNGKWAIYKYSKRVFFDGLWGEDPLIEEARGIVLDLKTGAVIQYPFTKVYNYGERGAGSDLRDDQVVTGVQKINGFLAAASVQDGELLLTTSGSFESPFVDMARETLASLTAHPGDIMAPGVTYMFEIVHKNDPHIIEETPGAYLIGARQNQLLNTEMFSENYLDQIGRDFEVMRPWWRDMTVAEARDYIRTCQIEGLMIRDAASGRTICKWKSPHYLNLKFLSRATFFLKDDFDRSKLRQKVEEELWYLIDYIFDEVTVARYKSLTNLERVNLLQKHMSVTPMYFAPSKV